MEIVNFSFFGSYGGGKERAENTLRLRVFRKNVARDPNRTGKTGCIASTALVE